ncbi:MAG: pyruvate kinase [Cyanobium sp. M30B3]|nr:MAG: pyruvate kinase [Cyanobium sp. M30B3]
MRTEPAVDLLQIREQLLELRRQLLSFEQEQAARLAAVAAPHRLSARNLLHFVAFHRHNHHRPHQPSLQQALRQRGLSTLAGCEPHLLASLNSLIAVVHCLCGTPVDPGEAGYDPDTAPGIEPPASFEQGHALLRRHSERLLGSGRAVMVTLPAAATHDPSLIPELVNAGMDVARINCAHDTPAVWAALAGQVRAAAQAQQRPCRIAMDLAGPKLRTGPLPALPGVVAARPDRDRYGRLLQPARILALPQGTAPPADCDPQLVLLPVVGNSWRQLDSGDRLRSRDASGRWRELVVDGRLENGVLLHCRQHCRFVAGLVFRQEGGPVRLEVAALPECPGELLLKQGERLRLSGGPITGSADPGQAPARVSCSLPEVLADLEAGQRVLFDDGKIGAVVVAPAGGGPGAELEVELEIVQARPKGSRLRADKGINLPDTNLKIPALTAKDRDDLALACRHADLVNYSFVRSEADVACLHQALAQQENPGGGVVLKIETQQAFLNLPRLLLAAMAEPMPLGVMIARGDLAVECGWDALSAIQEEILRVCAAAHVPCIWATEVLDTMAHHGTPTRPEITDAAMGSRAEALMLNKGANITETVRTLRRIAHHSGITRSDHSTEQADRLVSCLCF